MLGKPYDIRDLEIVMENLGTMLEAAQLIDEDASFAWNLFINSKLSERIECGDPKYTLGMSGGEYLLFLLEDNKPIYDKLLSKIRNNEAIHNDVYLWAGYALAQLQYETTMSFKDINKYIPLDYVLTVFNPLHEADLSKFVDIANERIYRLKGNNLRNMRKRCGYTQQDLALMSNVDIRNIQMYEQRRNDINKASVDILDRLANALHCSIYDLLERTIMQD